MKYLFKIKSKPTLKKQNQEKFAIASIIRNWSHLLVREFKRENNYALIKNNFGQEVTKLDPAQEQQLADEFLLAEAEWDNY